MIGDNFAFSAQLKAFPYTNTQRVIKKDDLNPTRNNISYRLHKQETPTTYHA